MNVCTELFFLEYRPSVDLILKYELNGPSVLPLAKFSIQRYLYGQFKIKGGNMNKIAHTFSHR